MFKLFMKPDALHKACEVNDLYLDKKGICLSFGCLVPGALMFYLRQCVARASHLIRICALPACACVLPARVCAIEHRGTGDEADMLYKIQKNLKTILVNLEI